MNKNVIILKSVFLIIFACCFNAGAYDDELTHKEITKKAVIVFHEDLIRDFSIYLKDKIGIIPNTGYDTILKEGWFKKGKTILELLQEGAEEEDNPMCRAANHFHDPIENSHSYPHFQTWGSSGLYGEQGWFTDYIISKYCTISGWPTNPAKSNATWATTYLGMSPEAPTTEASPHSWKETREHFYKALTLKTEKDRKSELAETFLCLGHVLHLLQDVSVPAHVRNDFTSHLTYGEFEINPLNSYTNPFEFYVKKHPEVVTTAGAVFPDFPESGVRLTDYWDTNMYTGANPSSDKFLGISEIINANYFSEGTMPPNNPPLNRTYPSPFYDEDRYQTCEAEITVQDEVQGLITYKRRFVGIDGCTPHATISLLNKPKNIKNGDVHNLKLFLDDNVHQSYAEQIIPLAIGYSAKLMEYFFRGTLEISAPEKALYSITDGSQLPQQFTHISATVENTSCKGNEEIGEGTIQAVAQYRKRTDYQPDLSADPPTADSREPEYTCSVSAPTEITSLEGAQEFRFDFSGDPIPAGITDFYLLVVFRGTLGKEKDTGVAVGLKDLNEPHHITIWNSTDRFYFYGGLYTAEEIRTTPELAEKLTPFLGIDPVQMNQYATFYQDGEFQVSYMPLPPGRHGRVIILSDASRVYTNFVDYDPDKDKWETYPCYLYPVIHQEDSIGFLRTHPGSLRGVKTNSWYMVYQFHPYEDGILEAAWPDDSGTDPFPTASVNMLHDANIYSTAVMPGNESGTYGEDGEQAVGLGVMIGSHPLYDRQ
ncbi:MAG: hypothetical protein GY795_39790 [Desulfobacterales bacterium]|nr:hypothetical protein [Desulfobacterales bacterium]